MKSVSFSFIFLVAMYSTCIGQKALLMKEWVGQQLEWMKVNDSVAMIDNNGLFADSYHYTVNNQNEINLIEYYWTYNDTIRHENNYQYHITKLTDDTLILKPLSAKAKKLFDDQDSILFINRSIINAPDFKFEKLIFSSSACFGTCPDMKMEIDSTGHVFFYGRIYTGRYKGCYEGQLNKDDLLEIKNILRTSEIDKFPPNLGGAIDAPTYHFVFYYDGKIRKSAGTMVPYLYNDLLDFLLTKYKHAHLKKSKISHDFGLN